MLQFHRIEVIDRFQVAGSRVLRRPLDFSLCPVNDLLFLVLLLDHRVEPINAGNVRSIIETQGRVVAQELGDCQSMAVIQEQRIRSARAGIPHNLHGRPRYCRFDACLDLFQRFHCLLVTSVQLLQGHAAPVPPNPM